MLIKIGDVVITKGPEVEYTIQGYMGGSIGIRGRAHPSTDLKLIEGELYLLREGSVQQIEIQTDDGKVLTGLYKINELNWKKERTNGNYELMFNIGLQKQ